MKNSARTPSRRSAATFLFTLALTASATVLAVPPVAVSPGESRRIPTIAESCPTFHWRGLAGGGSLELTVWRVFEYEIEELALEPEPVVRRLLPGSATSWRPSGTDCLARREIYAWSIRQVPGPIREGNHTPEIRGPGEGSTLRYFRVGGA